MSTQPSPSAGADQASELAEAWRMHQPIWMPARNPVFPDERLLVRCDCGDTPPEAAYEPAWFGAHLQAVGAPPYLVQYWQTWASLVEAPDGTISRDAIARELADYLALTADVSTVFDELTGLSKPNTSPYLIIDRAGERARERHAYDLCARAHDLATRGGPHAEAISMAMRELAEEWHPGAWGDFQETQRKRDQVLAILRQVAGAES